MNMQTLTLHCTHVFSKLSSCQFAWHGIAHNQCASVCMLEGVFFTLYDCTVESNVVP